jgi:S1-C subfamily serine protease
MPPLRVASGVVVAASTGDALHEEEVFFPGDVIHALNGTTVTSLAGLREALDKLRAGDAVVAHVERRGEMVYVAFELE